MTARTCGAQRSFLGVAVVLDGSARYAQMGRQLRLISSSHPCVDLVAAGSGVGGICQSIMLVYRNFVFIGSAIGKGVKMAGTATINWIETGSGKNVDGSTLPAGALDEEYLATSPPRFITHWNGVTSNRRAAYLSECPPASPARLSWSATRGYPGGGQDVVGIAASTPKLGRAHL
jgi:hypothetical protein